jgi:hypothetical protein
MGFRGGTGRESGLVGLLVALVVLGAMAAVAFAALGGSDGGSDGGAPKPAGLAAEVVPAAKADVDAVAQSGQALRSGIADQAQNACVLDARTLATAAQTYQVARGGYPASVDDLVSAGMLSQAPSSGRTFTFESVGGEPTGRVLVDGVDADAGCAAAG